MPTWQCKIYFCFPAAISNKIFHKTLMSFPDPRALCPKIRTYLMSPWYVRMSQIATHRCSPKRPMRCLDIITKTILISWICFVLIRLFGGTPTDFPESLKSCFCQGAEEQGIKRIWMQWLYFSEHWRFAFNLNFFWHHPFHFFSRSLEPLSFRRRIEI